MRKLLNQTLIYYAAFALMMLLLATPFSFWILQKLHLDDVDEAIWLRKNEFFSEPKWDNLTKEDIQKWNEFNRDIKILPDTVTLPKSKLVQQVFYDRLANEWEPYRVLYQDIEVAGGDAVLMIRINLIESADLMQSTAIIFLVILVVLLIGLVLLTRIVSNKLWAPFYQTLSQIEVFDIEKKNQPHFTKTKTIEFHKLHQVLGKLIAENIKAFDQEKEFTQNASHELQTPLAIFQSKLDTLLQNRDLTADQASILQQLYDASARLLRINKNLLLLAKIENKQFSQKEQLNIRNLIRDVLPYFLEQAEEKQLAIYNEMSNNLFIEANKGLTEILINNLIMNAIRHNIQKGFIHLILSQDKLTVKNTGIDKALNIEHIFQRFSKSTDQAHSSGLGLAIVKKITNLNHWQVSYAYQNKEHVFSVRF